MYTVECTRLDFAVALDHLGPEPDRESQLHVVSSWQTLDSQFTLLVCLDSPVPWPGQPYAASTSVQDTAP